MANIQVIFDPATYEPDSLPAGMTIVDIGGTKYVQVILDGWNSSIKIDPAVIIEPGMTHFRGSIKYASGPTGHAFDSINTFFKLSTPGWVALAANDFQGDSGVFKKAQVGLAKDDSVGHIQIAGQVRGGGWPATVGDTIWLGKVEAVNVDPLAIFDPNIVDTASLPAGMSIVELAGIKYCQIITNGWSSSIPVDPYVISATRTHYRVRAKYAVGTSGHALDSINIFLKIANDSKEIGAIGSQAIDSTFIAYRQLLIPKDTVTWVQVAGQVRNGGWPATVGDTIWIGKVRVQTVKAGVVLDPTQVDPSELPAGWSIAKLGGISYMQVILNGWGSSFRVDDINTPKKYNQFSSMVKYGGGVFGHPIDSINTFLKLASPDWAVEIGASGQQSTAEFANMSVPVKVGTVGNIQVAGQVRNGGWPAVVGDTLWFGKVILADTQKPSKPDTLDATVAGSTVTLKWTAARDNDAVLAYVIYQDDVQIDSIPGLTKDVSGLADATYTFGVVSVDKSGNRSAAKTVDATVTHIGIDGITSQQKLIVYPNPANDLLNIKNVQVGTTVSIYSMTGELVLSSTIDNNGIVNINTLQSGLYTLRLSNENMNSVLKFIKK